MAANASESPVKRDEEPPVIFHCGKNSSIITPRESLAGHRVDLVPQGSRCFLGRARETLAELDPQPGAGSSGYSSS